MSSHSNILPDLPFYDAQGPLPIAHRGGDAAGPEKENSLIAFESAYKAGIRYGETDTVVTADGVLLAFHGSRNKSLEQKTGLPLRSVLQAMSYKEVQRSIRIGGERVPTLEEVLVTLPGMRFFIDPKTAEAVKPLAQLINRLKIHERVAVGAYSFGRTQGVAELAGERARICTTIGIRGGLALLGGRLNVPWAREYVRRTQATQFALPHTWVTSKMVEKAHALGLRMILWTPNTEADIKRAFDTGADGVISDRTHLVKQLADAQRR